MKPSKILYIQVNIPLSWTALCPQRRCYFAAMEPLFGFTICYFCCYLFFSQFLSVTFKAKRHLLFYTRESVRIVPPPGQHSQFCSSREIIVNQTCKLRATGKMPHSAAVHIIVFTGFQSYAALLQIFHVICPKLPRCLI